MATHFDRCLGCMACVTACPSGVQYDKLIERVRPQVEHSEARSASERAYRKAIFALFTHPARLRALAPGAKLGPKLAPLIPSERLKSMLSLAPSKASYRPLREGHGLQGAGQARHRRVHAGLHPARLLRRRQRGHRPRAERRGLGGPLAPLPALLRRAADARGRRRGGDPARREDDRRVREIRPDRHQRRRLRLGDEGLRPHPRHRPRARVLGQGRRRAPAAGLRGAAGRAQADRAAAPPTTTPATSRTRRRSAWSRASCCAASPASSCSSPPSGSSAAARPGSTTCSSPRPRPSSASARRTTCKATGADAIAAANPGCALQIARYLDVPIYHPMTLLDMSLRGVKP